MIFPSRFLAGIRDGTVTVAFRRWRRPTVRAGGTLLTAVGQISIASIEQVPLASITETDARRAGYASLADLVSELQKRAAGTVYRIELGAVGPDPRVALRQAASLSSEERKTLIARLARLDDHSPDGPWTHRTLTLIDQYPEVRAADLSLRARMEKDRFKDNVRKLKTLGLTESLEVGYRLSPRGRALLRSLAAGADPAGRPSR
jgi:hypothetical protein